MVETLEILVAIVFSLLVLRGFAVPGAMPCHLRN
jgi:hypothetical protein